jgi:hypothetical protein
MLPPLDSADGGPPQHVVRYLQIAVIDPLEHRAAILRVDAALDKPRHFELVDQPNQRSTPDIDPGCKTFHESWPSNID